MKKSNKTELVYTLINTVKDLPKFLDQIVTHDWDKYEVTNVKVTLLTKPRKTRYNDQYYTAWVHFNGFLERLLICLDENTDRHGIGGNWQDEYNEKSLKTLSRKFDLPFRYTIW